MSLAAAMIFAASGAAGAIDDWSMCVMQYASRYAVGTESSEVIVEAAYSSCRERETNARNAFLAEVQGRGVNTYQAQSAWSGTIEPARNAARQDAFNVIVQLRAKRPPTCL